MFAPAIRSRMKEPGNGSRLWVYRGNVTAFEVAAIVGGICEIVEVRFVTRHCPDDVVGLVANQNDSIR